MSRNGESRESMLTYPVTSKYIVLVQINENLKQGGRWVYDSWQIARTDYRRSADMISHWEDGDACVHELFYNVRTTRLDSVLWMKHDP